MGEGSLKKIKSTWKPKVQEGKIIRKFGSVFSTILLCDLGQSNLFLMLFTHIKRVSWTR